MLGVILANMLSLISSESRLSGLPVHFCRRLYMYVSIVLGVVSCEH